MSRSPRFAFALFLLLFAALVPEHLLGQTGKASISGTVADATGGVLPGAKVQLDPGNATAISNAQGQFFLSGLNAGAYKVSVSYAGFETFTTTATLTAGQIAHLDATLKIASGSENVTVTAEVGEGAAESINRELTSANILNVLTNQQIMSLPNFTIADAVGRLPGVTLERDEGDGKYIQVRGTEPRLTNTTIDGINVPSPEAGVRQVKLDTIPADVVESVEVNKTLSANQDGDAIGGSVNLVTRTAPESPTISAYGQLGYTPIFDNRHASQYGITAGKRFRADKRLGVLGTYTYDYNGRGIDDIEPSNDVGTLTPTYDSIDIREYRYDRTRWGTAGSADYKFSENSSAYARGLYSDFKDYGDKWVYTLNDNVSPANTSTGDPATITGADPQFTNSKRLPDYGIGTLAIGGKQLFTSSWMTWELSAARSRQSAAGGDPGTSFSYSDNGFAAAQCYYDPNANKTPYRPQWNPACTAKGSPVFDPNNYQLTELDLTSGQTTQLNLQAGASYAFNYHAGSHFSTFEFGFKIRNGHKGQFAYSPALLGNGPTMAAFLSPLVNNHYYGGSYQLGPLIDYDTVVAYNLAHPGVLVQNNLDTHLNGDGGNFNYDERITAGYLMNTIDAGRLQLQTGLRFEATNFRGTGYQVNANCNNSSTVAQCISPVNESSSYLDPLPSVQARYRFTNDITMRAVYGRGISRPDPQDIIPTITYTPSGSLDSYSYGNPALTAEHAHNFDLLYEQDLHPLGLLQVGYFYKILGSPIVPTLTYLNGGQSLCPETPATKRCKVSEIENAGSAWVGGFEFAYQQRLSALPGFLSGTSMFGNYTYTNSEAFAIDPQRLQVPKLVRQSPNAWNFGPSYDRGPLSMNLGIEYNQANINSYSYEDLTLNSDGTKSFTPPIGGPSGPSGDNYFYSHMQTDAQISYRLKKGFQIYANGQNLTNEVFGFYNGAPHYVNQREYYKPTYFGGLRWVLTHER